MKALQHLRFTGSRAGVAVAVGALVLGGGLGGVGYAAVTSGPVHTCVAAHTGAVRVAGKCTKTEKAIVLGARGATGKTGAPGAPGATGATGAAGPAGANGTAKAYATVTVDAQGNPTLTGAVGITDMTKPGGVNSNIYCIYVAAGIPLTEPLMLTPLVYAVGNQNVAGLNAQASPQQCHGAYEVATYDLNGNGLYDGGFNVLVP